MSAVTHKPFVYGREVHLPRPSRADADWGVNDSYYRSVYVEPDGSVLAWNHLDGTWTRCHSISEAEQAQARELVQRADSRRGSIVLILAGVIAMLFLLALATIDAGRLDAAKAEGERAADSGALAGAGGGDGADYARANHVAGAEPVVEVTFRGDTVRVCAERTLQLFVLGERTIRRCAEAVATEAGTARLVR